MCDLYYIFYYVQALLQVTKANPWNFGNAKLNVTHATLIVPTWEMNEMKLPWKKHYVIKVIKEALIIRDPPKSWFCGKYEIQHGPWNPWGEKRK